MSLKSNIFVLFLFCLCLSAGAESQDSIPEVVHPELGQRYVLDGGRLSITHAGRHQQYSRREAETYDVDVNSPKSVAFNPQGTKYYVNSLEGCKTVVYDARTHEKLTRIRHTFGKRDSMLWAPLSGLFLLNEEREEPNRFSGKPVETAFSHGGRYAWVPYYRRDYDLNAMEPSAVAVIDTQRDRIVRMFETGALPKMVASSGDGRWVAVSQWGENTVGLIDVSSTEPEDWHYVDCFVIDYRLKLDFDPEVPVNRDSNSGYCLRGTVFTPDGRYLLVGCMGGGGGIAVIDLQRQKYVGRVTGMMPNLRHLLIHDGWIYLSINTKGAVQRIRLSAFEEAVGQMKGRSVRLQGWETCRVPAGARTISISPDGRYIFAACNVGSSLAVVETKNFTMVGEVPVDSYPVGLDISPDGQTIVVTSQGRNNRGGNAVNIYSVNYE